nr:GtrA family protein [Roseibacterium elongatum]
MTGRTLVLRYTAFAVIAVLANLAAQRLVLAGADPVGGLRFAAAIAAGTLVGLVVKYVLDKRWIFYDQTTGARAQGAQFLLYALMGVVTTAIFWVSETAAWLIWGTDLAREVGAVLGLSVGYVTKYLLDRRYVFRDAREMA